MVDHVLTITEFAATLCLPLVLSFTLLSRNLTHGFFQSLIGRAHIVLLRNVLYPTERSGTLLVMC